MKNTNDKELNKNYRKVQLKLRDLDGIIKHQGFPIDQIDQSGDDCIDNPISAIIQNNEPLDEKLVDNSQNSQIQDETQAKAINGWDKLPDEIVEKMVI